MSGQFFSSRMFSETSVSALSPSIPSNFLNTNLSESLTADYVQTSLGVCARFRGPQWMHRAETDGRGQVTETVGPSVVKAQKSSDKFCSSLKERGRGGQPIVARSFHQLRGAAHTQRPNMDFHYHVHSTNTVNRMKHFFWLIFFTTNWGFLSSHFLTAALTLSQLLPNIFNIQGGKNRLLSQS